MKYKPCPFCGNTNPEELIILNKHVRCGTIDCPIRWQSMSPDQWNKRTTTPIQNMTPTQAFDFLYKQHAKNNTICDKENKAWSTLKNITHPYIPPHSCLSCKNHNTNICTNCKKFSNYSEIAV